MELGKNPVSKHQIQLEYRDEQADARRDCQTRLARPNPQAPIMRTEGNNNFTCSADHVQDWQPYPVDPYSCYICDHTCTHTIAMRRCVTRVLSSAMTFSPLAGVCSDGVDAFSIFLSRQSRQALNK